MYKIANTDSEATFDCLAEAERSECVKKSFSVVENKHIYVLTRKL